MTTHIIYMATNKFNDDFYIGATKVGLKNRRSQHLADARMGRKSCYRFHSAINKYGPESFEWSILHEGLTLDEAMAVETREIADRKPQYNITAGGRGLIGLKMTDEWREKIRKANTGRVASEETRAAMRKAHADNPYMLAKGTVCIEHDRYFRSVQDAAHYYGASEKSVGNAASFRGQTKTGNGLHFMFLDAPIEDDELRIVLLEEFRDWEAYRKDGTARARRKAVICINTGVRYPSTTAAAKAIGINQATVSNICNGASSLSGWRFRFECSDEIVKERKPYPKVRIAGVYPQSRKRPPPITEETREKFRTAAKVRGISEVTRAAGRLKASKPIICIETGVVYPNVIEAATVLGIPAQTIYASMYNKTKIRAIGLSFERKVA